MRELFLKILFLDIKSNLIKEDLVFACLCFGHYVYHTCLPLTVLFGCDGACPPARIINKVRIAQSLLLSCLSGIVRASHFVGSVSYPTEFRSWI